MSRPNALHFAFDALLFDMDGTVLTSIAAAERVWARWARQHGLDVEAFLPTVHGKRAIDTIRDTGLPGLDLEAEAAALLEAEIADVEGIEPIAGAADFLASLPRDRWALVTSAPRRLAERRIAAAGLPLPDTLISGDDVSRGKPAPDAFETGAARLGRRIERCLVFEDAPAGIQAAEAAGAAVLVVAALSASAIDTPHPQITDYHGVEARADADGRLRIHLPEAAPAATGPDDNR